MSKPEFITMGCRLNAFETEIMRQHAAAGGLEDCVIVNTCAVTTEATRQARQAIRKASRTHPRARIVVTGCAAQIDPEAFSDMPEVDFVLGNQEKTRPEMFAPGTFDGGQQRVRVNDIMSVRETAGHLIDGFSERARAFVEIQNGCDHRCTFCIIPYGRGPSRSVPAGVLVAQIERLVAAGHKEIVLTGVDFTAYGADLPGRPGLGWLVRKILKHVPELSRLRLSSIDSIEADEDLVHAIGNDERVMPHFHLSLQSGDNMILKRMKRRHNRDDAIAFCARVRAMRPETVFGADLIAGFPTETDVMFENTAALIDECGLTYLHVFPFSPRPGTPAAAMPQIAGPVIRARAKRLRDQGKTRLSRHLRTRVGSSQTILIEQSVSGHAPDFTPVRFETPQIPGSLVDAVLFSEDGASAWGRPV